MLVSKNTGHKIPLHTYTQSTKQLGYNKNIRKSIIHEDKNKSQVLQNNSKGKVLLQEIIHNI